MARAVRQEFKKIPKGTLDELRLVSHLGSTAAWRHLKRKRVAPITPISQIRAIARTTASRNKVKVFISPNPQLFGRKRGTGSIKENKHADGLALGSHTIYLHPILQYSTKPIIRDVIGHELDHIKVSRRRDERQRKQGFRLVKRLKSGDEIWRKS